MSRAALAACFAALIGTTAHAQVGVRPLRSPGFQPGIRYASVLSGLTGDCAKTPPAGYSQSFCSDIVNNSYTRDGTTPVANLAGAGWTIPSGCTATVGTGLQCVQGSVASVSSGLSATASSGYIIIIGADYTAISATAVAAELGPPSTPGGGSGATTSLAFADYGVSGEATSAASGYKTAKVAVCPISPTSALVSFAGASAQNISSTSGPTGSDTLYGGNASTGQFPLGIMHFVKILVGGVCNAANVQAASAN